MTHSRRKAKAVRRGLAAAMLLFAIEPLAAAPKGSTWAEAPSIAPRALAIQSLLPPAPSVARSRAVAPAVAAAPAIPLPPAGAGEPYVAVVDQDLRDVISEAARRMSLKARIGSEVREHLTNVRLPLEKSAFLATLEKRYGLVWYVEGDTLNVAGASETTTRILSLGQTDVETLRKEMAAAGIKLDNDSLRYLKESNSMMVNAPAPVVAKVWALIETLGGRKDQEAGLTIIRPGARAQ